MHELAVCQSLLEQVEAVAAARASRSVTRIVVRIGPLSGVEPDLLDNAFTLARASTVAAAATLEIEYLPVRIACTRCAAESEVDINRLICPVCGGHHPQLISGDELQLARVELELTEPDTAAPAG